MANKFHKDLVLDDIHPLPSRIYADIAARDADTDFNGNSENLFKAVYVDDVKIIFVLVETTPLFIATMGTDIPGIDDVLSIGQIIGTTDREITVNNDMAFKIENFDTDVSTFVNASILQSSADALRLTAFAGNGAGGVTGEIFIDIVNTGMTIFNNINSEGAKYAADYSAGFVDRSLVDKGFVDNAIASIPADGIDDVLAVGQIIDGNSRVIEVNNDGNFKIRNFDTTSADFTDQSVLDMDDLQALIAFQKGNGAGAIIGRTEIVLNDGNIIITDTIANKGMTYFADYSANFVNRSLVDKEFVDNAVSTAINPGGVNTNIQFNDAGVLGGEATFTFDKSTDILQIDGGLLGVDNGTSMFFTPDGLDGSGTENTVIGWGASAFLTSANDVTSFGFEAGHLITSGNANSYFGSKCGRGSVGALRNTGMGSSCFLNLASGDDNTGMGDGVGITLTTGNNNSLFGANADVPLASSNNFVNLCNVIQADNVTSRVVVGRTGAAAISGDASLELVQTDSALLLNRLTTTQETAVTKVNGMMWYNTTANEFRAFANSILIRLQTQAV